MSKIKIEIPDSCNKCPCYTTAKKDLNGAISTFYICRAFNRILIVGVHGFGDITEYHRCPECLNAELPETE